MGPCSHALPMGLIFGNTPWTRLDVDRYGRTMALWKMGWQMLKMICSPIRPSSSNSTAGLAIRARVVESSAVRAGNWTFVDSRLKELFDERAQQH